MNRLLRYLLITAGWLGWNAHTLFAQESMAFRHLDSRQGLSQNCVAAIAQDSDGLMWFGTQNGLNRYDGYRIQTYERGADSSGNLIDNSIISLYHDPETGQLWVCAAEGFSLYRPETDDFRHFRLRQDPHKQPQLVDARCAMRDSRGQLWVGGDFGLYRYQESTEEFKRGWREDSRDPGAGAIHALLEDEQGRLFLGTDQGLYVSELHPDSLPVWQSVPAAMGQPALAKGPIRLISQDGDGRMWVAVRKDGLFSWMEEEKAVHHLHDPEDPYSLSDNDVRAMAVGPNGRVWVGSFLGLNIYDAATGRFHHYQQKAGDDYSLGGGSVRSIGFDSRGSAWIGTYYDGVSYYNPESFRFTHHQPGGDKTSLSHSVISAFWEDDNGNVWIGTEGGGINYWNRRQDSYQHYLHSSSQQTGLSGNNVKTLLRTGDSLWIGTFASGLNLLNTQTGGWSVFQSDPDQNSLVNDNVYSLCQDGNTLWIGTYGGGINHMDLSNGQFTAFQHDATDSSSLASNTVRVLLKPSSDELWAGTTSGLDIGHVTASGKLEFRHLLPGKIICTLLKSDRGNIWVGTYEDGVFVFSPEGKRIAAYSQEQGLPSQSIFGMLEDDRGRIWVSSDKGLARIDTRDQSITRYNHSDGLDNLEYNYHACFKTSSGEMLFGGTQGFTSFFPNEIRTNTFVPPLVFTHLRQGSKMIRPGDETQLLQQVINETNHLVFPYNGANFTLGFAALDFLNPGNNHYAYKLEGLDQEWTEIQGQPEVSYTLQRSGDYVFRLKGGNNDGIWNQQERTLTITVLPPPWRTPLAYALYALLVLLLLAGAYWGIRIRHRLQIEQVTMAQQEALHQAKLRFYTNVTHEFRTPLTLILGPVEDLLQKGVTAGGERQLQSIRQNAERLLRLVNQLLNFRTLEHDQDEMEVAEGNIVRFLQEVCLSFQEQARLAGMDFSFTTREEAIQLWYDRDKLEKVFFNLLSNAFKFSPKGGRVEVHISSSEHTVDITISDSGPGIPDHLRDKVFERFFHEDSMSNSTSSGSGIGLALSKQLVDMHGGTIRLETESRQGATFVVTLPTGKAHFHPGNLARDFKDSENFSAYLDKARSEQTEAEKQLFPVANNDTGKDTVLIVEDNEEVRQYIRNIFQPVFRVVEARNGKEGLQQARSVMPDLIISDVMMPGMDGIAMCSQLKTNVETSHIPVILLTARTGQIFRVEGLETGADAYLTKPFSPYELKLRVHNLLEARSRIRNRFHSVVKLEPNEITVTSADELFLTKAMSIVEEHMEDPDFNMETFSQELAVSRPLLFTKLKAITNQTPNNFVKALRLKRSAQLLTQSDLGIAEIAYKVGFRDSRYFSKCFQKEYDLTPSEYRAQNPAIIG